MSGTQSRKILNGLHLVVGVVFREEFDEAEHTKTAGRKFNAAKEKLWIQMLDSYKPMMEKVRQHEDLKDKQIARFHRLASSFIGVFVDLLWRTGGD